MKRLVFLLLSCLLLSATGFAQGDKSVARMNFDIPGMDAAMAEKAVAAVSAVPGVTEAKANVKNGKLRVSMAPENRKETRKAVEKALKDAGIKTAKNNDAKKTDAKKDDGKKAKTDDKSGKKAKAAK